MISLFSGYGGLDLAVQRALGGARVVAVSDIDAGPCAVLAHRYPGAPNLKDITRMDWHALGHVDIMAGGFCCQSVSTAGRRAGLKRGTRTGLWFNYAEGIRICRPGLVVAENVGGLLSAPSVCDEDDRRWPRRAGLLERAGLCHCRTPDIHVDGFTPPDQSREAADTPAAAYLKHRGDGPDPADLTCARCGLHVYEMADGRPVADDVRLGGRLTEPTMRALGRVLADLSSLGYDAVWRGMEAADVGAPHHRLRIFVVAWPHEGRLAPDGEPWARFDPALDVWATGQADLLGEPDVFMGVWPRSGVMAGGAVYALPAEWLASTALDHPMLPTPLSRDGGHGGSMTPEAKRAGNHAVTLQDIAEKGVDVLYTPRAADGTFGRSARSGAPLDKSGSLTTQARLFDLPGRLMPTPNALYDSRKTGTPANTAKRAAAGRQLGLGDMADLLATPNCMDMLPARSGEARDRALRRGAEHGPVRASTGNLREDVAGLGEG